MRRFQLPLIALVAWLAGIGCTDRISDVDELRRHVQGMNVIVVLFDAAAADHIGFLGYERPTTPFLSELAASSFVFENAYAQASATPLSILSLFTGAHPVGKKLPALAGEIVPAIGPEVVTLAQSLASTHPRRLAWSANRWVCEELGYSRGYTDFFPLWADSTGEVVRGVVEASYLRRHAQPYLVAEDDDPFFAYLHFIEPHLPYAPPEPFASLFDPEFRDLVVCNMKGLRPYRRKEPNSAMRKNIIGLYDGNLAYADDELRKLLAPLLTDGRFERSIFIFLSDHGEAFWEHGARGHGINVYEEVVRVPLMIRIPGLDGGRIGDVVELVDIFPTLLSLFDLDSETLLDGDSLLPKFFAEAPADSLEQRAFFRNHESTMESGVREGRFKLIRSAHGQRSRLYDLVADPTEVRDLRSHRTPALQSQTAELSERLGAELTHILSATRRNSLMESGADSLDADAIEKLKALGYFN